ncbi:MAG: KTSC domain-containing protein [Proteobacteria bacterium]|nr:KTSC domain-containing protein [Pseudomonadota bacterium]
MPRVESTAIRAIDYDAVSRTLYVVFIDGDGYAYFEVPPALYADFLRAESKGRFFAEQVRDRFGYQQLT